MPEFRKSLDVDQGFNFRKDRSVPVGFLVELKVSDKEVKADITCKDPMNPTTDLASVAVLSDAMWGVGCTDAIYFSGQVSAPNRNVLATLAYLDLTKVEVLFKFRVYDYDPVAKKYYQALHTGDAEMKGILEKRGNELNLRVADDQSTEVQSPINYSFAIGIKPQPVAQTITIATADQMNVVKSWGIKQG